MRFFILTLVCLMQHFESSAQKSADSLPGVYRINGIMEMATGLELHRDSTFQFFFIYGALDRLGSGTWSYQNNTVILNTRKRPSSDFLLVESKRVPGNKLIIQMAGKNPFVLSNVNCLLAGSTTPLEANTDSRGLAYFPAQDAQKLSLIFTLCPDRYSDFRIDKRYNYYKFTLQPWVTEIFLENYELKIDEDGNLNGRHPFLEKDQYTYEKESLN